MFDATRRQPAPIETEIDIELAPKAPAKVEQIHARPDAVFRVSPVVEPLPPIDPVNERFPVPHRPFA